MNIRTRDAVDAIEELKRRSRRLARCLNGTAQRVGRAALRVGLEIADRADRLEPTGAISVLISQTERVAHRHAATLTSVPSGAAGALRFLFAREVSWISSTCVPGEAVGPAVILCPLWPHAAGPAVQTRSLGQDLV